MGWNIWSIIKSHYYRNHVTSVIHIKKRKITPTHPLFYVIFYILAINNNWIINAILNFNMSILFTNNFKFFYFRLVLFLFFSLPVYSTYCWINRYWNRYCSYDDGSYEYWNAQNDGNPYKGLKHYVWNWTRYYYETPDEKCNRVYPWTIFRNSDWWCACEWDPKWISSWNSKLRKCPTKDEKCDLEYPWTVRRYSDWWCACKWDPIWTSSWSKLTFCSTAKISNYSNSHDNYKKDDDSWTLWWIIWIFIFWYIFGGRRH